jgi:hypothetical protein
MARWAWVRVGRHSPKNSDKNLIFGAMSSCPQQVEPASSPRLTLRNTSGQLRFQQSRWRLQKVISTRERINQQADMQNLIATSSASCVRQRQDRDHSYPTIILPEYHRQRSHTAEPLEDVEPFVPWPGTKHQGSRLIRVTRRLSWSSSWSYTLVPPTCHEDKRLGLEIVEGNEQGLTNAIHTHKTTILAAKVISLPRCSDSQSETPEARSTPQAPCRSLSYTLTSYLHLCRDIDVGPRLVSRSQPPRLMAYPLSKHTLPHGIAFC